MADIDKILNQAPTETIEESAEIIESNPSDLSQLEVETEEEGSEVLSLGGEEGGGEEDSEEDFAANLAESLSDEVMSKISNELRAQYEVDLTSRDEWEQAYIKGLDLLGFKYVVRSQPFRGASSVSHPLLAEAVTQFQAGAYKELLPSGGPVKTAIVGEVTTEVEQQAERVKEFMNYQIMYKMKEYDPEMDQLLFHLPLAGSAFKKVITMATWEDLVLNLFQVKTWW